MKKCSFKLFTGIFIVSLLICFSLSIVSAESSSQTNKGVYPYFTSSENFDIEENSVNDSGKKGLTVKIKDTKGKDSVKICYNNYINTDDLAKGFLSFQSIPESLNKNDFDYLIVTLTDAVDEESKVVYAFTSHPDEAGWWDSFSACWATLTDDLTPTVAVSYYNTNILNIAGTNQSVVSKNGFVSTVSPLYKGTYMDCGYMLGNKSDYFVRKTEESKLKTITLAYENKTAFINGGGVASFADPLYLASAGENLSGTRYSSLFTENHINGLFSSGYAKLEFSFLAINSAEINLHINKIGGQNLDRTDGVISDETPYISARFNTNGIVGYKYPIPQAYAYDLIDGDLSDVAYCEVYKEDVKLVENKKEIEFEDDGIYEFVYSVKNKRGSEFSRSYYISVYDQKPKTDYNEMTLSYSDSYNVGDKIVLPEVKVCSDLSVEINKKVDAELMIQVDGEIVENFGTNSSAFEYLLDKSGTYSIIVKYTDDFGFTDSISSTFTVVSTLGMDLNDVPLTFTRGKNNPISDFNVENTLNDVATSDIYRSIYIDNNLIYKARGNEVLFGDLIVKAEAITGSSMSIRYSVGFTENEEYNSRQFTIPVVGGDYISDYVAVYDGNGDFGDFAKKTNLSEETLFTVNGETGFMLPQKLPISELSLSFDVKNGTNVEALRMILTSYRNRNKKLVFDITERDATSSIITLNGERRSTVIGSFSNDNSWFNLVWDNSKNSLTEATGSTVLSVHKWYDGTEFKGFEDDLVCVSFEFINVIEGNAVFSLKKVCNQPFVSTVTSSGVQKFSDVFSPLILFKTDMSNVKPKIGETLVVSSAMACDVLDCVANVTVRVITPDGNNLYSDVAAQKDIEIVLRKYGKYTVTYKATDSFGLFENEKRFNYVVSDDVSPAISVSGDIPESCNKGDKISIPSAIAFDNLDGNVSVQVFVLMPDRQRKLITDGEYIFEESGIYEIIYFCHDAGYNFTQKIYKIIVR